MADALAPEEETWVEPKFHRVTTLCPRCGTTDNMAVSTQGRTQYRKCRRPICRYNFKVVKS